jgi:peroxiredoxin
MRKAFTLFILLFGITNLSCAQLSANAASKPEAITKDVVSFLIYQRDHLHLTERFSPFDALSKPISKGRFLKALTTGLYLPLRLDPKNGIARYRLYKLRPATSQDVRQVIVQTAENYYNHYRLEGQRFPSFRYVDLDGKVYTPESTRGKLLVLNSWFINCKACNEEMPALNELTDQYKNRKDILFVGIAFDSKEALRSFLKKKTFKYAIASVKESYIEQTLHSNAYPTHWLVDKKGVIVKVVDTPAELAITLSQEVAK